MQEQLNLKFMFSYQCLLPFQYQGCCDIYRSLGERSRAVSFSKAYSNVPVPSELLEWLNRQESQPKQPQALSQNPQAVIGKLLFNFISGIMTLLQVVGLNIAFLACASNPTNFLQTWLPFF